MNIALLTALSQSIARSRHYKWWVYTAVAIGLFVTVMDQSGVNIALPKIAEDFDLDLPTVQWITLSYVLSTAAIFMPVGRLSDMVGRKRVYIIGSMIFAGAAAIGGTAQVFPVLIVAKVIQGIGAAGIQANSMAMIADVFPEQERGKALGLYSTIIGTGLISGPIIGGLLVTGLGWRSVFFANIPVGLISLAIALIVLVNDAPLEKGGPRRLKFDWVGAGLSSAALVSFLLGMSNGHRFGWGSPPVLASLLIGPFLLVVFLWWQLRTSDPMLDLSFFRNRVFSMGVSARFVQFLGNSSIFFMMPFYLIQVLGFSARKAGLIMVPGAVCLAIMGPISGRLSDKVGSRWLTVAGLAMSASAMFIFSRLSPDSSPTHVIIGLILSGSGMGAFNSANASAIIGSQTRQDYGFISAFMNLTRTFANVTGIALATTIVTVTMGSMGYEPSLAAVSGAGGEGVRAAFASGLNKAFLAAGSFMLLALVISGLNADARATETPAGEPLSQPNPSPPPTGED
ncbi:MAG: MFS transporter [Dehalococcoidia bacterium]